MKAWYQNLAHLKAHTALSNTEIADQLQVSRNTVQRALRKETVQALIAQIRQQKDTEIAQVDTERIKTLVKKSYDAIEDVLDDPNAAASAKVQAATLILKGSGEMVERQQHEHKGVFGVIVVDPD